MEEIDEYEVLLAKITHPKQREFLENYPKFNVTQYTCDALGMGDSTVYNWLNQDELFNKTFGTLKKRINQKRLELFEKELDNRALHGSKQSDILLMFALKAENPDKYREKPPMITQLTGNITVKMDIPPYKDEIIEAKSVALLNEAKPE